MVKRALDLVLATCLLVVFSPLILASAIAIFLTSGRPVFFRQARSGLHGVQFSMVKFRTMRSPSPDENMFATDAARVTQLGKFLRRTSLDELPTLANVLRGDMSLVGPRPLLPEYDEMYSARHRRRLDVRPGVTGLAQISGRQHLKFSERFELDVQYVESRTISGDVKILARTVLDVINQRGVETGQSLDDIDDVGVREALGIAGDVSGHEVRYTDGE